MFSDSLRIQLVKFIAIQIRRQSDDSARLEFASALLAIIEPYGFIFNVLYWIQPNDKDQDGRLSKEQFKTLWDELLSRIIRECEEKDIFDKFSTSEYNKICIYWAAYNRDGFNKYIETLLNKQPNKVIHILRGYLPLWHAWGGESRYGDFTESEYKYLSSTLDTKLIDKNILTVFPELKNQNQTPQWRDMDKVDFTDIELAQQFRHWHLIDQKNKMN